MEIAGVDIPLRHVVIGRMGEILVDEKIPLAKTTRVHV
jgi:hypothetical protein